MEKNIRFLLFFLIGSLPLVSMAQKENWTFSDRTGIKGVQFSVGSYKLINNSIWQNMLPSYVQEKAGDSVYLIRSPFSGTKRALIQFEVVYAPFRFKMNPWLRNMEVFGGISHRSFYDDIRMNRGGVVNETDYQFFERTYSLEFNHTSAQVRLAVNRAVLPSWMVYGTMGLGVGISRGLTIRSSDIVESYYSPQDSTNTFYTKTNFVHPAEGELYQSKGIRQQSLSLGLKFYVTCRLNIYAEYGIEFLQIHRAGEKNIHQNSQGFQLGLRFKFNPPEPAGERDEMKEDNVFW